MAGDTQEDFSKIIKAKDSIDKILRDNNVSLNKFEGEIYVYELETGRKIKLDNLPF